MDASTALQVLAAAWAMGAVVGLLIAAFRQMIG